MFADYSVMAEMFGNSFIIVEVTADDTEATQIWIARAKPSQAVSLVLAELPEGWKAELLDVQLSEAQQKTFEELNLQPGDVHKISRE